MCKYRWQENGLPSQYKCLYILVTDLSYCRKFIIKFYNLYGIKDLTICFGTYVFT